MNYTQLAGSWCVRTHLCVCVYVCITSKQRECKVCQLAFVRMNSWFPSYFKTWLLTVLSKTLQIDKMSTDLPKIHIRLHALALWQRTSLLFVSLSFMIAVFLLVQVFHVHLLASFFPFLPLSFSSLSLPYFCLYSSLSVFFYPALKYSTVL